MWGAIALVEAGECFFCALAGIVLGVCWACFDAKGHDLFLRSAWGRTLE
jgi:hypothetical protein